MDYACNMKCSHCSAVTLVQTQAKQLTLDDYSRLADQLCKEGCLIFHFTGGEPLLRKDLEDIIRTFKPKRCGISIQSNGILASRVRLELLRKAGADIFCVSIDSGIPEEHDTFRNYPGAFNLAIEALDNARDLGYQTMISTCLSHANIDSEGFLKAVALAEERGIWHSINLAVPAGNWRECNEFMLTDDDQHKWREFVRRHPLCHIDLQHNWKAVGCGTVKEKLYLTAYGDIMPCPFIQVSLGSLREESIKTIRKRAMLYPKFAKYWPQCLAAEDREFIESNPCYQHNSDSVMPMPWKSVPELYKYMGGGANGG
ncbi:MAG: radical SAM protein [Chitinispirillia bacterium]|nr:radical SAM protein [Chitinispirillia bacterium]